MKRVVPLYPFILAAFPTIAVYALNLQMVPLNDVWRPLAVSLVGGTLLFVCSLLALRNLAKAALWSALILVLFASYGPIKRLVPEIVVGCVDIAIVLGSFVWILRTRRDVSVATRSLNFGAFVLIVLPLLQIMMGKPPGRQSAFLHVSLPVKADAGVFEKPDVFFIVLDGYGRSDQLKRVMDFSNEDFLDALRNRGFYVADQSHSNYVQTQLSLAATLNMSFLQDFPAVFPRNEVDREPMLVGMNRSYVSSYFKRLGYKYVSVTSGFDEVDFSSADLRFDHPMDLTMIEGSLVQLTPVTIATGPKQSMFVNRRNSLTGALQNLIYLAKPTPSPRFVVAHIIAPHPPFSFNADGSPNRQPGILFGFWDASAYMEVGGTRRSYKNGYTGQLRFLDNQILEVIDSLLAGSKTRPVIIVEGDHGSKLGLNQETLKGSDLKESFGNLVAVYGPDSVQHLLYPKITSINTFRVLLDGLFGENLPLLPDRSFYSPFSQPYRFTEVTKQVAD